MMRPIPGWPLYAASEEGQIFSLTRPERCSDGRRRTRVGRVLRGQPNSKGYLQVYLYEGNGRRTRRLVHALVLEAFVGQRPTGAVCRHLNGNCLDNRVLNLTWGTKDENVADMVVHGSFVRGERSPASVLTEADVIEIRRLHSEGARSADLAVLFGVARSTVRAAALRQSWRHVVSP